jgi:hypothetical protein
MQNQKLTQDQSATCRSVSAVLQQFACQSDELSKGEGYDVQFHPGGLPVNETQCEAWLVMQ